MRIDFPLKLRTTLSARMVAVTSISPVPPAPLVIMTDCVYLPLVMPKTSSSRVGHFFLSSKYSARGVFAPEINDIASDA